MLPLLVQRVLKQDDARISVAAGFNSRQHHGDELALPYFEYKHNVIGKQRFASDISHWDVVESACW
jgi:hypothetical protein